MQTGAGFSVVLLFVFSLPVLGDSDTLPDHNVFLFLISFRSIPLLVFSYFLPLSLSNATLRSNEWDERDEKDDANTPSWNTPISDDKTTFASFLDEQKLKYPIIAYDTLINICQ